MSSQRFMWPKSAPGIVLCENVRFVKDMIYFLVNCVLFVKLHELV